LPLSLVRAAVRLVWMGKVGIGALGVQLGPMEVFVDEASEGKKAKAMAFPSLPGELDADAVSFRQNASKARHATVPSTTTTSASSASQGRSRATARRRRIALKNVSSPSCTQSPEPLRQDLWSCMLTNRDSQSSTSPTAPPNAPPPNSGHSSSRASYSPQAPSTASPSTSRMTLHGGSVWCFHNLSAWRTVTDERRLEEKISIVHIKDPAFSLPAESVLFG
jgi:hypothetical protein